MKVSSDQSMLFAIIPDMAALDMYPIKKSSKDTGGHNLKEQLREDLQQRFSFRKKHDLDVTTS